MEDSRYLLTGLAGGAVGAGKKDPRSVSSQGVSSKHGPQLLTRGRELQYQVGEASNFFDSHMVCGRVKAN